MKPLSTIIYALFFVISMLPQKANAAVEDDVIVGKIADTYDVTPVGQFAYSIPLAVASGTGGMEPKLSIVYNSSNGTGLLGQGFDLQGLSIISRAPQNLFNDSHRQIASLLMATGCKGLKQKAMWWNTERKGIAMLAYWRMARRLIPTASWYMARMA